MGAAWLGLLGRERGEMMRCIAALLELSLAPTPAAPARARAAVSDWLDRERHDRPLREIAVLLVTELVTNSIRHALIIAGDRLQLTGSLADATLRIELRDSGTGGTVARRARARDDAIGGFGLADDEIGGFGLELVDRLSSAWGVERDAQGTTVWLELTTSADAIA